MKIQTSFTLLCLLTINPSIQAGKNTKAKKDDKTAAQPAATPAPDKPTSAVNTLPQAPASQPQAQQPPRVATPPVPAVLPASQTTDSDAALSDSGIDDDATNAPAHSSRRFFVPSATTAAAALPADLTASHNEKPKLPTSTPLASAALVQKNTAVTNNGDQDTPWELDDFNQGQGLVSYQPSLVARARSTAQEIAQTWTTVAHALGMYSASDCLPTTTRELYVHITMLNGQQERKGTDLLLQAIRETAKKRNTLALDRLIDVCEEMNLINNLCPYDKELIESHYTRAANRAAQDLHEFASEQAATISSYAAQRRLVSGRITPPTNPAELTSLVTTRTQELVDKASARMFKFEVE